MGLTPHSLFRPLPPLPPVLQVWRNGILVKSGLDFIMNVNGNYIHSRSNSSAGRYSPGLLPAMIWRPPSNRALDMLARRPSSREVLDSRPRTKVFSNPRLRCCHGCFSFRFGITLTKGRLACNISFSGSGTMKPVRI